MDIRDIFENKIKIESKVMSIESLFNNKHRVRNTDFKPSYQRNYVWDDEKASYFIESILLGTEIPPLVFFRNIDKIEVIDGRQRYQTILRFKGNEFKLRKNGLHKLGNIGIANKTFKDLDIDLQDLFWDTKLRIIEFSLPSYEGISHEVEEFVKREIFKRYNSGITPLKPTEIDNAIYLDDNLNAYLKKKIQEDEILYRDISSVFHFEKNDIEVILKKIRQLLVQHEIPIKYYSVNKQSIISKFYDALFDKIDVGEIEDIYQKFVFKLNLLVKIKASFKNQAVSYNRLISECLFWSFSVLENEGIDLNRLNDINIINSLVDYVTDNIDSYSLQRSSFTKELNGRYSVTAHFFEKRFDISLNIYLDNNQAFKQRNQDITPEDEERVSFEELRINKPEPSSIAITDISRSMERQRFLIRPPYQRKEVINKKKSSSIIESILLGIKIPPFFVFKREDGIREVLDGQQRLLSILGFIGSPYLNEKGEKSYSNKNGYALYLKNSILSNLNGDKYEDLSLEYKERILNFDLWIIEIDKKYNKNFEPIDLFVRLNDKPYPIKEDTFEMWNSYISRDIIDSIKSVHANQQNWFYFRKNNSRMEDENIYTALAYLQYSIHKDNNPHDPSQIDIYKVGNKINFRLKSKNEITKVLEGNQHKNDFITAINNFEFDFLRKLKELLTDKNDVSINNINKNLDDLFLIGNGRRTQQSFYALWYFLFDIPFATIKENKVEIRKSVKNLFLLMTDINDKSTFEESVKSFKNKYEISIISSNVIASLKEISYVDVGIKDFPNKKIQPSSDLTEGYTRYNSITQNYFSNYGIDKHQVELIDVGSDLPLIELFEAKILILLSNSHSVSRFNLAIINNDKGGIGFRNDIIGIKIKRPNILPQYVLALLSSRYYYHKYYTLKRNKHSDNKPISVSDINNVEIPIIKIDDQIIFSKVIDYIICSNNPKATLFFERVLDALVYETFFEDEFRAKNIEIKKHVSEFLVLEKLSQIEMTESTETIYKQISAPDHILGKHLLSLLNVSSIIEIESQY